MKATLTLAALLALPCAMGQNPELVVPPAQPSENTVPELPPAPPAAPIPPNGFDLPPPTPTPAPPAPATETPPFNPTAPGTEPVTPPIEPNVAAARAAAKEQEIQASEDGYVIKDAALNDIFQFLAKEAGKQYFHNAKISAQDYQVTGHLNDGNPLQQMEELAFMYGLVLYTKGNTVYALTQAQLSQLPSAEFHYQLKYLRPTDIDQIKALIQPMLSPATGIVNFEPKTNTIIIVDTAHRIEQARDLLHNIDKAKGQIVVETKILRINSNAAERKGVNWSGSLGETGTSIELARSLNSVFGFDSTFSGIGKSTGTGLSTTETSANNLVLSPVQLNGVLHALAEGGYAKQVSNPTLITEDNEQASIAIIDRIPIITSTTSIGTTAGTQTEEVRYKIDEDDKSIAEDPENHREIGISMTITPTLLPDGTIRMDMRPRSAQIAEQIRSATSGNTYPRVTESMIKSLARVPDGHSLVIGGFYGQIERKNDNKVPVLGDIPVINFFFKSKETVKENSSLVFIVTPTSYDPSSPQQNHRLGDRVQYQASLPQDHDWVDPNCNPGPAHEPNFRRGIRDLQVQQAPYYPRPDEARRVQGAPAAPYIPPAPATPAAKVKPRFNKR